MTKRIINLLMPVLALAAFGIPQDALAKTGTRPVLYVDNSTDNTVSVIDPATNKMLGAISPR